MLAKTIGGWHAVLTPMRKWFHLCGTPSCGIPPGPPVGSICLRGAPTGHIWCSRRKWWDLRRTPICFTPMPMAPFAQKSSAEPSGAFCANGSFSAYAPINDHGSTCANGGIRVLTLLSPKVPYEQMAPLAPRRSSVHRPEPYSRRRGIWSARSRCTPSLSGSSPLC
jgi:hypothetical protein